MAAEHDEAVELDGHAFTVPRSTAAATASASTVSRTSWTRRSDAPRSNAATAGADGGRHRPARRRRIAEHLAERALPREADEDRPADRDDAVEPPDELEVLVRRLPEADARVEADPLLRDALRDRELEPLLEERRDLGDDVVVARRAPASSAALPACA